MLKIEQLSPINADINEDNDATFSRFVIIHFVRAVWLKLE